MSMVGFAGRMAECSGFGLKRSWDIFEVFWTLCLQPQTDATPRGVACQGPIHRSGKFLWLNARMALFLSGVPR